MCHTQLATIRLSAPCVSGLTCDPRLLLWKSLPQLKYLQWKTSHLMTKKIVRYKRVIWVWGVNVDLPSAGTAWNLPEYRAYLVSHSVRALDPRLKKAFLGDFYKQERSFAKCHHRERCGMSMYAWCVFMRLICLVLYICSVSVLACHSISYRAECVVCTLMHY